MKVTCPSYFVQAETEVAEPSLSLMIFFYSKWDCVKDWVILADRIKFNSHLQLCNQYNPHSFLFPILTTSIDSQRAGCN